MKRPAFPFATLTLLTLFLVLPTITLADDFANLFNGKDLKGWKVDPSGSEKHWRSDGKILIGENDDKKGSILWTEKEYTDFEMTLDYKTESKDYDSGVFTRATSHQIQIGISRSLKRDMTGCIYAPKDKQGSYPGQTDKVKKFHKLNEWNKLRIVVKGDRIQTFLNDEPFVDYQAKTLTKSGPIGLQLHGGVHMKILFKNVMLRQLKQ